MQSRYYDPEIGRFINADAFASTGQGVLGNNMFAYCGNNPTNYCDPLGSYYRSLNSSFSAVSVEVPGPRWNSMAELQMSCSMWMPQEQVTQVIDQSLLVMDTTLQSYTAHMVPQLMPGILAIGLYSSYNKCRVSGLGTFDSSVISVKATLLGNFPYTSITNRKSTLVDIVLPIYADYYLDSLINEALVEVSTADRISNRQMYMNNRAAGVAISGGMQFVYTDYTGMRRDLFGNP